MSKFWANKIHRFVNIHLESITNICNFNADKVVLNNKCYGRLTAFMDKKLNRLVLGLLWGDEGKAKIVDIFAGSANVIVRFQGGSNAGHTVVVDDKKFILHQIPAGILHSGKVCILGAGMVVDIPKLFEEIRELREAGVAVAERLFISSRAHIVTKLGKLLEGAIERSQNIGTTKRGIGTTYAEKVLRTGLRMGDLMEGKDYIAELLEKRYEDIASILLKVYNIEPPKLDDVIDPLFENIRVLRQMVKPVMPMLNDYIADGVGVLFEGAQGTMLDIDWGTYPYVTSSNTTIAGLAAGAGVNPRKIHQVIGVVKAFTTRVGEGPFPTEIEGALADEIRGTGENQWDEFGSTTGRPRRIGWLDVVALHHAVVLNGVDAIALTKLDALDGLSEVKLCRSYWSDGDITFDMPASVPQLRQARPIYDTFPGWKGPTRGKKRYKELPDGARQFVERLEELLEIPVLLISTGPARDETIIRRRKG